jgi:pimeloyl-ACP methyl ester carboxylesterase
LPHIDVGIQRLEYKLILSDSAAATVVFLHEGLGSLALWKDFPREIAASARCNALVYSRLGYGLSTPLRIAREPAYMHDEALDVLPRLLDLLEIYNPILLGHSDGASIALIHAGSAARAVRGLIVMAPHIMVEDLSITSIAAVRHNFLTSDLPQKLQRYHEDLDGAFWGWNNIWLDPRFRNWNIAEHVRRITCPILAIQGFEDEFGTMEQIDRLAKLAPVTESLKLRHCGHSPYREQAQAVLEASAQFIKRVGGSADSEVADVTR